MDRINHSTATPDRKFTAGSGAASIPATVMTPAFANAVQEELCNVVEAAGLTLDPEDNTQLEQAVNAMIAEQAVTVEEATETVAGILTLAQISGTVRAYTRQQYNAPVVRVGQSGSQAVDCDQHQLLSITATAAIAFAAPTNLTVGKTLTIMVYSASAVAITYDAAYLGSSGYSLPSTTTAGKWMVMSFMCHKSGSLLLTGVAEEA